jgi:hypothetical protein
MPHAPVDLMSSFELYYISLAGYIIVYSLSEVFLGDTVELRSRLTPLFYCPIG